MSNVKFDNIELLFVFIPLFLLVVIPFFIFLRKNSFKFHNIVSLFIHIIICALLSLCMAQIKTEEIETQSVIYIVADVSNTTKDNIEEMDNYIKEFSEKLSSSSELGIVAFGKDSIELVKPGEDIVSLTTANIDKSSTNIQEALTYTASLFEDNIKKRIVLLSDGIQTDGDALLVNEVLQSNNIRIDAVYFEHLIKDDKKEIQINKINGNPSTFINNKSNISIDITSSFDNISTLKLYDNDVEIYNESVMISNGNFNIELPTNTSSAGSHTYKVVIENEYDESIENNTYYFNQNVHDKCEILVISSLFSDTQYIKSIVNDNINITSLVTYNNIPTNIENYIKYDEIILSNVDINQINNSDVFISTLETLVSSYGKSLLTFGGKNTYFSGGFYQSKLKDMLPIDINPSDTKKKTALIMVIDNSGSMSGSRLEMAKKGAVGVLDILQENDYVGVVTFESKTKVVQPLTSLRNKNSIIARINKIGVGDGTMMTPGLAEAYEEMKSLQDQMSNREVIIISDGMPGDDGQEEVVRQMAEDGITVSCINIGGAYNGPLLQTLAKVGSGNYYSINSGDKIPTVLFNEVKDFVMEECIEDKIKVNIVDKSNPMFEGISSLPALNGYNYSKAKYNSTTLLNTSLTLESNEKIDNVPLFTYWDYGAGRISSFMSDISSSWAKDFFESESGKKLFSKMITENYPDKKIDSYLLLDVNSNGITTSLEVSVPKILANMKLQGTLTSPSGEKKKIEFAIKNGKYHQTVQTIEKGVYKLDLQYHNIINFSLYTSTCFFTYSYSNEYDEFSKSDNILLYQLVENIGLVSNNVDEIVNINQEDVIYSKYYSTQLLLAAIILFILDVALRLIRLKDIRNLFKKKTI